jgi:hypothetical protein
MMTSILFFSSGTVRHGSSYRQQRRLLLITASKSGLPLASIPKSLECLIYSNTWALFQQALVGIQPQLRQIPTETFFFNDRGFEEPSWEARDRRYITAGTAAEDY